MQTYFFDVSWKVLVVRGVIGILFGIIAMVWPVETVIALAILWGIWALIDGIGALWLAFTPGAEGSRALLIVVGLVAIIAAFFAIFSPSVAAATLMWILGIWLVIRGVIEFASAFTVGGGSLMWLMLLGSALSVLIGVLFMWRPGGSAVALAVWFGLIAAAWGIVLVVLGLRERKARDMFGPSGPTPAPA